MTTERLVFAGIVPLVVTVLGCATPEPLPPEIATYVDSALDTMEREALRSSHVDWDEVRAATHRAASGSTTTAATYPALRLALARLGDNHSFLQISDDLRDAERAARGTAPEHDAPRPSGRKPSPFASRMKPAGDMLTANGARVARVVMPQGMRNAAFATAFQERIRKLDGERPDGWIVDLRGNGGGNMWPMLAGLGPLLGDGPVGGSIDASGRSNRWYHESGAAIHQDATGKRRVEIRVTAPAYEVRRRVPIAVLHDRGTASSGEAMVLAFQRLPLARSFGEHTYGASTSTRGFKLEDGANLVLAVSVMADRAGRAYPAGIPPDVAVNEDPVEGRDPAVDAAVAWIVGRRGEHR